MAATPSRSRPFQQALKAARIGEPEAQYEVGLMYANGVGTAQDLSQAIAWITKAAQRGLSAAQYLLATRYAAGVSVQQDERAALTWYLRASEQGHVKATYKLGQMMGSLQLGGSRSCMLEAAQGGLPEAQYELGLAFASGLGGEGRDLFMAAYWFEKSARQGYAPSQYAYGCLFRDGSGVDSSPDEAVRWFRSAAAQDHPAAQMALENLDEANLALRHGSAGRSRRRSNAKERRRGSERWLRVALSGSADDAYHVAQMHEAGLGVTQDAALARHLYLSAAERSHCKAQLALAKILEIEADPGQAAHWYEQAALQGSVEAQAALGRLYSASGWAATDALMALAWHARAAVNHHHEAQWALGQLLSGDLRPIAAACFAGAAEAGLAEAQYRLGECYAGGLGLDRDAARAVKFWLLAAEQGHREAAYALGLAYRQGVGVDVNLGQAIFWLEKSAAAGHAVAQWNLGGLYVSGASGIAPDLKLAFQYCREAADQGFAPGQASLGLLYSRMGKVTQAEHWLRQAAEQGDAEACFNLAILLRAGKAAKDQTELILRCLTEAAEKGLSQAQLKLGLMFVTGDGVLQDPVEGHKWFLIAQHFNHPLAAHNVENSLKTISAPQAGEGARRASQWLASSKYRNVKN